MANRIEFRSEIEKEKNGNRKIAKWKQAIRRGREVLLKRNQKQPEIAIDTHPKTEKLRLMGKRQVAVNY
ncbi:unnamed protein product, partial [Sphenostylis stenocarpa]